MGIHIEIGLRDENTIIQTIERASLEDGNVNIIRVLERLEVSEISPDDIVFVFHQLREEGAITPESMLEQEEAPPSAEESEFTELMAEERRIEPNIEDSPYEKRVTLLDPEDKRTFLEKLRSITDTSFEDTE